VSWLDPDEPADVELVVNGEAMTLAALPRKTLADALRDHGLTGTHLGCEHGVCGACTVLLDGAPIRSCLVFAVQASGREVETIENFARDDVLHPVQRAFHEHRALQCGFCTPGFVVLAVGLLRREPHPTRERIVEVLSSNLCRCTGYGPIIDAVVAARHQLSGGKL
jgi:aerobic-type carbon monoxide dehydrogenase small subunit (CoxS/CutS family)